MKRISIIIPEDDFVIAALEPKDDLPVIIGLNRALYKFKYKKIFPWNLSLTVFFKECNDIGFPSDEEIKAFSTMEDYLCERIETYYDEKPNALFLARVTWNKTREYIYRIYNPEIVNNNLQEIINTKKSSRDFVFKIEHDKNWELNEWYYDLKKRL